MKWNVSYACFYINDTSYGSNEKSLKGIIDELEQILQIKRIKYIHINIKDD